MLWNPEVFSSAKASEVEGCDKVPEGLLVMRDWGKPRKILFSIAGLRAEIWTQDLPNTKQES
jgi:hypothetical protein